MCFGGGNKAQPQAAPAPAPPPPAPLAEETDIQAGRIAEDRALFGTSGSPSTRVDRSLQGGATAGGTGIRM